MIEFRLLKYFSAVARLENISKAAEDLNVSPSPLSRQIRQLEEELGVQLFIHHGQRLTLTQEGRILAREASEVLGRVAFFRKRSSEMARGQIGSLDIGFVDGVVHTGLLPTAIRRLSDEYDGLTVSLTSMRSIEQMEALKEYRLDFALTHRYCLEYDNLLSSKRIASFPLVLAIPSTHYLAAKTFIQPSDLDAQSWAAFPRSMSPDTRRRFLEICRVHGFNPTIRYEVADTTTVLSLVGYGLALALVNPHNAQYESPHIQLRRLPWIDLSVDYYAIWRKDETRPHVKRLISLLDVERGLSSTLNDQTPVG